jgi:FkbM family methyltransferase
MRNALKTFNRRVPYVIRLLLVLLFGVFLYGSGQSAVAVISKMNGEAPACVWPRTLLFGFDLLRLEGQRFASGLRISQIDQDAKLGIQRFSTSGRPFWIKQAGTSRNGKELLRYLLSEHEWMASINSSDHVKAGDVVVDCGAHVGTFTDIALRRGASKVVAIEPDPVNLECLRRNFVEEIASGRVIVVPKGVWSSEKVLTLYTGGENSGTNSMVMDQNGGRVDVPVTKLDNIVAELKIGRVHFIKMDIEGAEREALRGGLQTIKRDFPTLMLDTYHLPDDMQVLPAIIHGANSKYRMNCGPCEETFTPHVSYFHQ